MARTARRSGSTAAAGRWRSGRARSSTRSTASSCSSGPRWAATARWRRHGSRPSASAGSRSSARAPRPTRPSGARVARRRSRRSAAAAPRRCGRTCARSCSRTDADEAVVEQARGIALEQQPGRPGRRGRGDPRPRRLERRLGLARRADADRGRLRATRSSRSDEALTHARRARDGAYHVFEGCGHLPSLERPDEFERVLEGLPWPHPPLSCRRSSTRPGCRRTSASRTCSSATSAARTRTPAATSLTRSRSCSARRRPRPTRRRFVSWRRRSGSGSAATG